MQTRTFGRTQVRTTPIGFGSWAVGRGPQDDEGSVTEIVQVEYFFGFRAPERPGGSDALS